MRVRPKVARVYLRQVTRVQLEARMKATGKQTRIFYTGKLKSTVAWPLL